MMRQNWGLLSGALMLSALVTMTAQAEPVKATWLEAQSDHFRVYSEAAPADLSAYVEQLEQLDAAMRQMRAMPDAPSNRANPLSIYVVKDISALQRLCGDGRRDMACENVAGFYIGRAEGSVVFTPRQLGSNDKYDLNPQIVLFHEYAHHFMLGNFAAAYPSWFVEGFAEFNATADFGPDGRIAIGKMPYHRAFEAMNRKVLPLSRMLAPDGRPLNEFEMSGLYGRGWALTHYLTFSKERAGQLAKYLSGFEAGRTNLAAANAAFGDLNTLERELYSYLHQAKLSFFSLPSTALPSGKVTIRQLSAGEIIMMPVRLRLKRGVDAKQAASVVQEARKRAAPYPVDLAVQETLAEAEYDAGFDDNAEAAADRALKTDPHARVAMIYKGQARIRRLSHEKTTNAAAWREARSWLIKANRLNANDALPLLCYYTSFHAANEAPTANAIDGLIFAFEIAPQDTGLRWLVSREYLLASKFDEARKTLGPLAFDPHASANNLAAVLIALIDKGETATIKAALDEMYKRSEKPAA